MLEELVLVKRAKAGDEEAFSKIVNLYKNYVFAIILNFIKDNNEAENVAQEVFLQIYLSLPKYENENLKGWIGKIASNKSIDWIRKRKSKFKEELLYEGESVENNGGLREENTPESIFIEKERKEEINNICNSLPEVYKDSIVKFYLEGKSYEEIATLENVSIKTIASRIYRGKLLLKEKWREKNETL